MVRSELLSSISSIVAKSEIRNPKSKIEAEAYLNGTSQGELVLSLSKEHPRTQGFRLGEKNGHIRGRSKLFMKYPG